MTEYDRPPPPTPDELRAIVAEAASFAVRLGQGGGIARRTQTLHEARLAAARINADTRRKTAVIYALDAAGRAFLVPDDFDAAPNGL
jgi:hypothetical protein